MMSTRLDRQIISNEDTNGRSQSLLGHSITRAIPSPNGEYIAAVASPSAIHVVRCSTGQRPMLYHVATVTSRQAQKVLAHAATLRWSPEIYSPDQNRQGEIAAEPGDQLLRTWLLVSDGQRMLVLCIDIDVHASSEKPCTILADYDLGSQLGNFSHADFAFSHEYAILIQNVGIQASIISLTHPEQHDIMNIKYSDSRGLAMSNNNRYFSIITRSNGQDVVVVFATTEMGAFKYSTFAPQTYDAQGIKWCPESDPLLCVWDSAAYGLKVSFFTANGHHLRQIDLNSESLGLPSIHPNFEGLGANTVDWLSRDGKAVLSVFDSTGQLHIQQRSGLEKFRPITTAIRHPDVVDAVTYHVWQESQEGAHMFSRLFASFVPRDVKRLAGADQMAMNANCELIATKESSRPWTLWIWDFLMPQPLVAVNFRDRIKQLLWHPTAPEILVIVTSQKQPILYIWHATKHQILVSERIIMSGEEEASNWEMRWLSGCLHEPPLMFLSSPRQYDIGILDVERHGGIFQNVICDKLSDVS